MRSGPSRTAEAVCLMRATDQRHPPQQRILDDPYARYFLGRVSRAALAGFEASGWLGTLGEAHASGLIPYVLTRHRFIDQALSAAIARGLDQLVVLGAGYDTRAWRFASELGTIPVFEVDHPSTAARKAAQITRHAAHFPQVDRRCVHIDFQTEVLAEALSHAGFKEGARTFWVWEGVSMYLLRTAVKQTLADILTLSGPGAEIAMDYWFMVDRPDPLSTTLRMSPQLLALLGEPITFGIHPEDVGAFVARLGWQVADLADADELAQRYIRDGRHVYPSIYTARLIPAAADATGASPPT